MIRVMTLEDYEEVFCLWKRIKGFAIRSLDDSKDGVTKFLKRNPNTSIVKVLDGRIVGSILCGHDGRRGCFYHVCVDPDYRMRGIGKEMVSFALSVLEQEGIGKVNLIAFTDNAAGNAFWKELGWTNRVDLNYYDYTINSKNTISINK
ncbi:MAG: GNAT family N-acetyltransferase [Lachnospiraceae bacterium]|nr:GNAT family N-acetyltransferase [Lachnospiraceae bacterium]MDD3659683.1 GNAT family N-acetyltransferase [Lachnospiraceae bacterium]